MRFDEIRNTQAYKLAKKRAIISQTAWRAQVSAKKHPGRKVLDAYVDFVIEQMMDIKCFLSTVNTSPLEALLVMHYVCTDMHKTWRDVASEFLSKEFAAIGRHDILERMQALEALTT